MMTGDQSDPPPGHHTLLERLRDRCSDRQLVREIDEALNDRSERERQRLMESVSELAGSIAHAFSNQLQIVLGFASRLERNLPPGPARDQAHTIVSSTRQSSDLVRRLLAFSRRGGMRGRCRVDAVVRELINGHRGGRATLLHLVDRIGRQTATVNLAHEDLTLLVGNLIDNALEADAGTGRVVVEVDQVTVPADRQDFFGRPLEPGTYIEIAVIDRGPGIDPAIRQRVFDPFFSTKPPGRPGAGLGLALVHNLVADHDGDILLECPEQGGTRVAIRLPMVAAETVAVEHDDQQELTPPPLRPSGDYNLLIVDDEVQVLNVARMLLHEEGGYGVVSARDGVEALEILARDPQAIDLVVLDMIMPRMGGLEALQQIRTHYQGLPVIIATGYGTDKQLHAARQAGAVAVINKPYPPDELLLQVAEALRQRP